MEKTNLESTYCMAIWFESFAYFACCQSLWKDQRVWISELIVITASRMLLAYQNDLLPPYSRTWHMSSCSVVANCRQHFTGIFDTIQGLDMQFFKILLHRRYVLKRHPTFHTCTKNANLEPPGFESGQKDVLTELISSAHLNYMMSLEQTWFLNNSPMKFKQCFENLELGKHTCLSRQHTHTLIHKYK